MEQGQTQKKLIPAPTGGWNARDPLMAMAENDAIELVNYFPDTANVINRGGTSVAYSPTLPSTPFQEVLLHIYTLAAQDGTEKLFIFSGTPAGVVIHIYRLDGATWTDVTPAWSGSYTPGCMVTTTFRNYVIGVQAGSTGFYINSTDATATLLSGAGPTIKNLFNVTSFNGHLYFLEYLSSKLWFLDLDAITGASTGFSSFDLQSLFVKGGCPIAFGETSKQSDATNQNLFFVASSQGEILVFQGSYPFSPTWSLIGRYFVGKPLGPKSVCYRGRDAHIATTDGVIPIGVLLNSQTNIDPKYQTISDKIRDYWAKSLIDYPVTGFASWEATYAPTYKMFLIQPSLKAGLPLTKGQDAPRLVQNVLTGAWCQFTGFDSAHWTLCNDTLYFIANSQSTGADPTKVYTMDKPGTTGNIDALNTPAAVVANCRTAFNFLDDVADNKHITGIKTFFDLSAANPHDMTTREVKIGVDSDFGNNDVTNPIILQTNPTALISDNTSYKQVNQVPAEGTCFSLLFKSQFSGGYSIKWNAFVVDYEVGGFES